jgi:hypothetical protein
LHFFSIFEALMFYAFGGVLMLVEIRSIRNDQTTIEFYQKKKGKTLGFVENLERVFGRNSWTWLLPVDPKLQLDYFEEINDFSR